MSLQGQVQVDWGKLIVIVLSMVSGLLLLLSHTVDDTVGVGLITTPMGYVLGNGRLLAKGLEPQPMLKRVPGATPDES